MQQKIFTNCYIKSVRTLTLVRFESALPVNIEYCTAEKCFKLSFDEFFKMNTLISKHLSDNLHLNKEETLVLFVLCSLIYNLIFYLNP